MPTMFAYDIRMSNNASDIHFLDFSRAKHIKCIGTKPLCSLELSYLLRDF